MLRCHPTRPEIVSISFENGKIFFFNINQQDSYIFSAHERPELQEPDENGEFSAAVKIEDMAWDPSEDNLLVSFGDQGMCLISFQGFTG